MQKAQSLPPWSTHIPGQQECTPQHSPHTSTHVQRSYKNALLAGCVCVAQKVCRLKLINSTNKRRMLKKGRSNKTVRHKQRLCAIPIMKKEHGKYRGGKRWTGISREGK